MNQHDFSAEGFNHRGQGRENVAEDQLIRTGNAACMCGEISLEDENIAVRHQFSQMIISPTIAEAQFERRPVQFGDPCCRLAEAVPLRLHAADEAIQPAHCSRLIDRGLASMNADGLPHERERSLG